MTATGTLSSIGTDARPIQTSNFVGTDNVADESTVTLIAGGGGIYLTDWITSDLTIAGATASGAGNIRIVTANAGGHNMFISGNVNTGSGNIYLAADDNLIVGPGVVIGGAGFSGTVWMQANRDNGTAGQEFTFFDTASIVTTNTTNVATGSRTPLTQAVYLDIAGANGLPSNLNIASITAGDGGRIVLNGIADSAIDPNSGGWVIQAAGTIVDAGANGTIESIVGNNTLIDGAGMSGNPFQVAGGSVVINSKNANVTINGASATSFSGAVTGSGTMTFSTSSGALTVNGNLTTAGTTISLIGAEGVVLAGPVGDASTGNLIATAVAGNVSITSPQVIPFGKTWTLTGASPTQISGNVTVHGSLGGSNIEIHSGPTLAGTGNVTAPLLAGNGTLAPAGTAATGNLTTANLIFGAASVLNIELNGVASLDRLTVNGSLDIASGSTLNVSVGGSLVPLANITIIDGDSPITGNFAGLPEGGTILVGSSSFTITYTGGGDGHDVVLSLVTAPAPTVTGVVVNGSVDPASPNSVQSRLTSITITFSTSVNVGAGAFSLSGLDVFGGEISVPTANIQIAGNGTNTITLTFVNGTGVEFGSLMDGTWTLDIENTLVTATSGATPMAADYNRSDIRKLFGDFDGNGQVNLDDFEQFGNTFSLTSADVGFLSLFDFDGNEQVNLDDFEQFGNRFGLNL